MWNEIILIDDQIKMFINIHLVKIFEFDLAVHVGETDFPFSLTGGAIKFICFNHLCEKDVYFIHMYI